MTIQQNVQQATAALHQALRNMVQRYPFHAEWLSPDRWHQQPAVGTMAVTVKKAIPRFFYSPTFVCTCSEPELEGVIHHELNHLVFRHPFLDARLYPNRHALTIAEEVTVNEHVPEPLPGNPLTLDEFPELPAGEGTIARYHRLADRDDLADHVRTIDLHAVWDQGESDRSAAENLESVHQEMLTRLLRERDHEAMRWALSGIGMHDGTGTIASLGDPKNDPKPINWTQVLASTIGQRVRLVEAFHRPPRRMPNQIGIVPGVICRPEKPPLVVAIDTSSSMQRPHFERIRNELEQLRRLAEVTVIQCDKVIHKTFTLRQPLQTIVGRGGTDLRPPLAANVLNQHRPSLVIYFTDGDGPVPNQEPMVPLVWCLPANAKPPASWGRVVRQV